jgi:DNA-directed RNA polymerase specialized sigma24 family protein
MGPKGSTPKARRKSDYAHSQERMETMTTAHRTIQNQRLAESTAQRWEAWLMKHQKDPVATAWACAYAMDELTMLVERVANRRTEAIRQLQAEGWSLAEIGAELGMSRARVDQIGKRT